MKIELEIDDKYKDANLFLMWSMVPIARYLIRNKYWEIKTDFCINCGKCCDVANSPFKDENGNCEYIVESQGNGRLCSLKTFRPVACSVSDICVSKSVKWKRVN